ncbi:MAG: VPLPA-CTERM sorting domain-containing protein [Gammaproteobacteria bacterium]|jgi:hypothetical protein
MNILKLLTASVLTLIASTSMASTIFTVIDDGLNIESDTGFYEVHIFDDEGTDFLPIGYTNSGLEEFFPLKAYLVADVASIPVPATVWLFGAGLIGLVAVARRRA